MVTFGRVRFIKAVKIFDGKSFLPPGIVLVYGQDHKLEAIIGEREIAPEKIEHLEGLITPGFVNAHCHLELSHLRSQVTAGTGFCSFAMELMEKRGLSSPEAITESMQEAEKEMIANGIVAVGDISNGSTSFGVKREKKLRYHTFVELIGLNPVAAPAIMEQGKELLAQLNTEGLRGSLAAHAPYSASTELIRLISEHNARNSCPFSIHNQESVEEHLFFMGEKSNVHDLYAHLKINIGFFVPPLTSSLLHYLPHLCGRKNIMVHNTFTSAADIKAAEHKKLFWCFCPSANLFIEKRLPDFSLFIQEPERICIGTDSLASNTRLDVLTELNHLSEACGDFSQEQLLSMITGNGATALGLEDDYGKLVIGRNAGLNLLRHTGNKFELIQKVY
jgi:cytosine/adenosine deaminase-related metal-dependent hydrolase